MIGMSSKASRQRIASEVSGALAAVEGAKAAIRESAEKVSHLKTGVTIPSPRPIRMVRRPADSSKILPKRSSRSLRRTPAPGAKAKSQVPSTPAPTPSAPRPGLLGRIKNYFLRLRRK